MDAIVKTMSEGQIEKFDWGAITWLVSGKIGNSDSMTFGKVVIKAGRANPRHSHSNCDEILHLLSGRLDHSVGDKVFPMNPGDTISVPRGVVHNAKAVGDEDAVMVITFSSAHRKTKGE
ncbi:MAG: cupin domain-containing protein [Planctomycetota bacterium]